MLKPLPKTPYPNIISVLDLKSFYAVVECVERGLDPMKTPLVVADKSRGTGTIVLAVSPFLKKLGVPSRLRVFDLPKRSDIIFATPQMGLYLQRSAQVMQILLDFVGEDDLHVYSIDEAFMNLGPYLSYYKMTPEELMLHVKKTIYKKLRLLATVGIGDNPFLAKSALDNESKKTKNGIAYWTSQHIDTQLWPLPIGDMWGVAHRMEAKLQTLGIFTIGDLAHYPLHRLHAQFGAMGEQLHRHANGIDESNIREKYVPDSPGISMGQVLFRDYQPDEIPVVIREMSDDLCLRLRLEKMMTNLVHLSIGYSKSMGGFSHQMSLIRATDDNDVLYDALMVLYHKFIEDKPIRNVTFAFRKLEPLHHEQLDLFVDPVLTEKKRQLQQTLAVIKHRFGHNAVLRTSALLDASTTKERHTLIGGHRK